MTTSEYVPLNPYLPGSLLAPTRRPEVDTTVLRTLRRKYARELFERVIPFWERHSPDGVHGGYFNCLDQDGSVYDTTKHVWLQARQVFMFSRLFRAVEQNPTWLTLARSGAQFLQRHARRDDGRVFFALTADGRPVAMQRKIFSECFYVMAMAEFGRATGEDEWLAEARRQFALVWQWAFDWRTLGRPSFAGETPLQQLAIPMILLNLIEVLTDGSTAEYRPETQECIRRMMLHVHVDRKVVFERVAPDGAFVDTPAGRQLNPGHAIEAGWFLQHWAQRLGRRDLADAAVELVRWSHDLGWDPEWGGLFYFLDCKGHSPPQLEWSMKLWWPHCEALYAHLLDFALTGERADFERFLAVDDYAFSHFSDPVDGEWFGYLDRRGDLTHRFKGGPYKGFFHVPRSLWLVSTLLERLEHHAA